MLHTGPPRRTEHTIECRKFAVQPGGSPGWTLSIARPADLQHAVRLIHDTLLDTAAP